MYHILENNIFKNNILGMFLQTHLLQLALENVFSSMFKQDGSYSQNAN